MGRSLKEGRANRRSRPPPSPARNSAERWQQTQSACKPRHSHSNWCVQSHAKKPHLLLMHQEAVCCQSCPGTFVHPYLQPLCCAHSLACHHPALPPPPNLIHKQLHPFECGCTRVVSHFKAPVQCRCDLDTLTAPLTQVSGQRFKPWHPHSNENGRLAERYKGKSGAGQWHHATISWHAYQVAHALASFWQASQSQPA